MPIADSDGNPIGDGDNNVITVAEWQPEAVQLALRPDRSRLIQAARRAMVVQAVAIVAAIMLASPDYIDRIVRPTICTGCLDLRGLAFILWGVVFAPIAVAIVAVSWGLRPGRIWPAWVALAMDLLILGLIAYGLLVAVTGHWATYNYAPAVPVQILQALLVFVSDLVSLLLLVRLLNATRRGPRA